MPWDFALILLVLATLVPWRGAVRMRQLLARPHLATTDRLALYASTIAFQWFAVAIVVWRSHARGLTPADLGLSLAQKDRVWEVAAALTVLLALAQLLSLRYVARLPPERQGFLRLMAAKVLPQNFLESLAFLALTATVALCEELLYRGFVFAAIERATSSAGLAVAGSALLFALAHLYQGKRGVRTSFFVGLLFAVTRIWTGSIAPTILTHLVVDLLAGLVAPRWLRPRESATPPGAPSGADR